MNNPIKTFEPNEKGRDFVIGDLHGAYTVFENLLANLNFDKTKDRMFSVGDLVDRGPESLKCLGLLREPWFHATLSNHEQMMYEAFNGGYMGRYWFYNGGNWGMEAWNVARALQNKKAGMTDEKILISEEDYELIDLLPLVEQLPFLMTVNLKNGKKVHIIHAELPPGFEVNDEVLTDTAKVMELATQQSQDGDYFLWGRYKFYSFYAEDLSNRPKVIRTIKNMNLLDHKNLSPIVSGHTILQRPMEILGQTNIDTCAYGSYGSKSHSGFVKVRPWCALTCIELDTWQFFQATPDEFRTVEPLVINKEDLQP